TLTSVYFDTSDADLRSSQLTLRLRRAQRQWTQTLKNEVAAGGGLHVRGESDHPVTRGVLDLSGIDDRRLRKQLGRWQAAGELLPRFETVIHRTTWLLHAADGARVECALDQGEVRTLDGRRKAALCEVELELKSGAPLALFAIARDLVNALPLVPEAWSKAERGYALWRREPLTRPRLAGSPVLHADATAAEAMSTIVGSGLAHLHRNWEAARASPRYDPEHVHQMRVASRRLRTAFTVFGQIDEAIKAHPLVAELRWLAGLLGEARNWDVLLAETFPKLLATFPDEPGLPALARGAGFQRRRVRRTASEALQSQRYLALVFDLGEFVVAVRERPGLQVPAAPVSARLLSQRQAQLRKRAKRLTRLSGPERHLLRIAAKKMRYTAEFFGSLYAGGRLDRFLRRFSQLQKALGTLNDLATTRQLMSTLAAGAGADAQRALGLCTGWSAGLEQGSLTDLARRWKAVERTQRFWPDAVGDPAPIAADPPTDAPMQAPGSAEEQGAPDPGSRT
ncbi:MAG: CHAD domain-containing protein, partial [Betaproteobacteria bacterium]